MFASRERDAKVDLAPGQERVFRLPPMSPGPVVVKVFDADFRNGPRGNVVAHTGLASDLQVTLLHPGLEASDANSVIVTSLWHDALWRLRIRRNETNSESTTPWRYRVMIQYPSQLPVVERKVPAFFFERGFDENWNLKGDDGMGYILVQPDARVLQLFVEHEFGHEFGIGRYDGGQWNTLALAPLPVEVSDFAPSPVVLSVGAGPLFQGGPTSVFVSARISFPAGGKIVLADVPGGVGEVDVGAFTVAVRLYLYAASGGLAVSPSVDAPEIFRFLDSIPTVDGNEVKQSIETGLRQKLVGLGSRIQPWLVGGPYELHGLMYEPGPGDTPDPTGIAEPATGRLMVHYVGPKSVYQSDLPATHGGESTEEEGSADELERLFTREEMRDEEPEPIRGQRPGAETALDNLDPVARMMRLREVRGWGARIGRLKDIEHIVVLMQENRSFDQMLGYLSRDNGRTEVDGLNALPPDPQVNPQFNHFKGVNYFPQREASTAWPDVHMHGPGHDIDDVTAQMQDDMGGFVANWAARVGPDSAYLPLVMNYFGADQIPVYAKLAEEFAICDRWFCAFPGGTWPNRFLFLGGALSEDAMGQVEIHNPDIATMIPRTAPILLDLLGDRNVDWRVFEHGYSFPRLYGKYTFETSRIVPFEDPDVGFAAVARTGLPPVTFIEPDYIEVPPGNDDHAPADVADGQTLVGKIMASLVQSPSWDKTLFIITYDEHGGFYDHVKPPRDAVPLRSGHTDLGPRVPTFVVSPYIARGTVLHTTFDHTSIGATIVRRFCGPNVPHVSDRMAAAKDLQEAITLDTPRPASDFAMFGAELGGPGAMTVRSRKFRQQRIGKPESLVDFHWFLSAVRLITGNP